MASAQLLRVTNAIDSEVREIADNVLVVDDRVAGVNDRVAAVDEHVAGVDDRVAGVDERVAGMDERVAGVDERVAGVDDRVAGVDDRVKDVDDKLVAVIDGAECIFNQSSKIVQLNVCRWTRGYGSYPTNSRRRRSSETLVVSKPHSCPICRLSHPHRESITTGSS